MVILNPTETSPGGGGVCQMNGGVFSTNDHVLSPARGSPVVSSLPGAETYGLQNALKRWKALEQQSIPLENNAQELIYARERKDFDDLRRRYFESKRSKMESSSTTKETPPPASSKQTTTIPITIMKQHQNVNKILEQQQQMPNLTNFYDFNPTNFRTINNQINTTQMLNHRDDFYNAQMPIMNQQNFTSNMIKERPKLKRKVSSLDDDLDAAAAGGNFQHSPFLRGHQDAPSSSKQRRKAATVAASTLSFSRNNAVVGQTAVVAAVVANPPPPTSSLNAGVFFDNFKCSSSSSSSNNQLFHVPDLPDDVVAEFVNNSNQLFDDVWKNADLNEFFEPSLQNYPESAAFVPLTAAAVQPQFRVDSSPFFDQNFGGQFSQTSFNYAQNGQNFAQSPSQGQFEQQAAQFRTAPQQNFHFYNNHQCQQRMSAYDSSEAIRSTQRYANFDQFI